MHVAGRQVSTCCAVLGALFIGALVAIAIIVAVLQPGPQPPDYAKLPLVVDTPWDSVTGGGWQYIHRTGTNQPSIASDAKAPVSPSPILATDFTGTKPDTEPGANYHSLPGLREVYTEYWIKFSANWTCAPAGCGKVHFIYPSEGGDMYSGIYCPPTSANPKGNCPGGTSPAYFVMGGQLQFSGGAGPNHPLGEPILPNIVATPVYRDRWYRIAHYLKWSSTAQTCDGIWRWYVDGILNGDFADICFTIGSAIEVQFASTRQITPPPGEFQWIDHTLVRGQ